MNPLPSEVRGFNYSMRRMWVDCSMFNLILVDDLFVMWLLISSATCPCLPPWQCRVVKASLWDVWTRVEAEGSSSVILADSNGHHPILVKDHLDQVINPASSKSQMHNFCYQESWIINWDVLKLKVCPWCNDPIIWFTHTWCQLFQIAHAEQPFVLHLIWETLLA